MLPLETKRLILRDFAASDWEAIYAYQKRPVFYRFYDWTERTEEASWRFVQHWIGEQKVSPRRKWQLAIVRRLSGELIGNVGLRMNSAESHEADIGYELDPDFWGQGYATEAASAILKFGFETLNLHRIWAGCVADNAASARILERIGMTQEGRLRDHHFYKDRYWDTLMYAILRSEWRR